MLSVKFSFFAICLILYNSQLFGQDLSGKSKINPLNVYEDAYREALRDERIDDKEARILFVLENALGLTSSQVLEIQSLLRVTFPEKINKDGEWLLIVQNIGWGLGLYGWGVPYVFGAGDTGILGGELMSPFLAYKLTANITRNKEMNHARAQLIRWGSTIGFRYGLDINRMRNFEPFEDEFDKTTTAILMLGVPLGALAGDWVWQRSQPSTGLAFVMTFWAESGAEIMRTAHSVIETEPNEDFFFFNDSPEKKSWDRKHNLFSAVGYPIGMWLGYKTFNDRQYSFGDAVVIHSMGLYGWGYGAIITDLIGIDFEAKSANVIRTTGTVMLPILADKYMVGKNYTFGQSVLIAVGGIAGGMFTSGILALFEVTEAKTYEIAALGGISFGLHYANSRLNVTREFTLSGNSKDQKIFSVSPTILSASDRTNVPALSVKILF